MALSRDVSEISTASISAPRNACCVNLQCGVYICNLSEFYWCARNVLQVQSAVSKFNQQQQPKLKYHFYEPVLFGGNWNTIQQFLDSATDIALPGERSCDVNVNGYAYCIL